jgi:hypothetical protein
MKLPLGIGDVFYLRVVIEFQLIDYSYVCSLETFGSFFDCEFNLLSFFKIAETFSLDCTIVYENIWFTLALYESVAFASVKPLDYAGYTFIHFIDSWLEKKSGW